MTDMMLLRVPNWIKNYGSTGNPDKRNVQDFMICESQEAVRGLQGELILLTKGNIPDAQLDKLVGPKRKLLFGTYANWAKMMLLWIVEFKE